jgi:hypothetical protein
MLDTSRLKYQREHPYLLFGMRYIYIYHMHGQMMCAAASLFSWTYECRVSKKKISNTDEYPLLGGNNCEHLSCRNQVGEELQ